MSRRRQERPRVTRAKRQPRRRRPRLLIPGLVLGALIAGIFGLRALGVFDPGTPIDLPAGAAARGDAVGTKVPNTGNQHVSDGQLVTYSTTPPTSGAHWSRPASWGIKDSAEPNERTTHNLEHGGIVIAYNGLAAEQVTRLKAVAGKLMSEGFRKIIVQPYPQLTDAKLALTAWSWLLKLNDYDEAEVVRFVRAHHAGPDAPEPNAP